MLRRDAALQAEFEQQLLENDGDEVFADNLYDRSDATCTAGYDNDGSTGLEIFEHGFDLAQRAHNASQDVYEVHNSSTAWFFIASSVEEVINHIRACKS